MVNRQVASHRVIKTGFFLLTLAMAATCVYSFGLLFKPLIVSILLTFVLEPVVNYFEMRGLKRLTVIIGLYVLACGALTLVMLFVVPHLVDQVQRVIADIPNYRASLQGVLERLQTALRSKLPADMVPDLFPIIESRLARYARFDAQFFMGQLPGILSIVSLLVLVPIITFFFLSDGHLVKKAILRMVPNRYFEMFVLLFHKIAVALQQFLRGQMIDALAVGVMTAVGLAIIGFPHFLLIGAFAGVGNMVPYLGPFIGAIPAVFVLLVNGGDISTFTVISVALVFVIVQFLEGTFIYPIAVGKSVDLHPLIVVLGIAVGGELGGILGMLLAIPLISVCKVTFEVVYTNLKAYSII